MGFLLMIGFIDELVVTTYWGFDNDDDVFIDGINCELAVATGGYQVGDEKYAELVMIDLGGGGDVDIDIDDELVIAATVGGVVGVLSVGQHFECRSIV